ncbi:MAG: YlmH/Sll1252 family protein [Bacillota bacterium]|nr:YlmH/Sll1252 family protein [Bacillota bacterium]
MNKQGVLNYYKDFIDSEGVFLKTLDQLNDAETYFEPQMTDFLSPDLAFVFERIAKEDGQIETEKCGGFKYAERVKLCFYPSFLDVIPFEKHISVLQMDYNDKFNKLEHKDALGALMAMGIQRKKIGDIVVAEGALQVAVDSTLESYLLTSIDKIGRAGVKVKVVSKDAFFDKQIEYRKVVGTVKSIRLDSIVAMGLNLSRSESQKLIQSELVKVNHRVQTNTALDLKTGDLISVRKHGRFIIENILGQTKKDRTRVELSFYSR